MRSQQGYDDVEDQHVDYNFLGLTNESLCLTNESSDEVPPRAPLPLFSGYHHRSHLRHQPVYCAPTNGQSRPSNKEINLILASPTHLATSKKLNSKHHFVKVVVFFDEENKSW